MKKSIVTAIAAAAMVTVFLSGTSIAGPKRAITKGFYLPSISKAIKSPILVPLHKKHTVASALAACKTKFPGLGINKVELHPGTGWLCIVGDIAVGWL